jgi:hypothetical protein
MQAQHYIRRTTHSAQVAQLAFFRTLTKVPARELTIREILTYGFPGRDLQREVKKWRQANLKNLWRRMQKVIAARVLKLPHFYGSLSLVKIDKDGRWVDFGLASMAVVTTAGVNFLVSALQNNVEPETLRFHGFGTGTNAEAVGDTALQTELTTQYAPDNTRPTGSLTQGASANIFRTIATLSPDSGGTIAITEHGIFSQAATGGGTLLDRSVFAAQNLVAGSDSLQATYDYTMNAGG